MNSTTGAEATALSMAARVSEDSRRACRAEGMANTAGVRGATGTRRVLSDEGRAMGRKAYERERERKERKCEQLSRPLGVRMIKSDTNGDSETRDDRLPRILCGRT